MVDFGSRFPVRTTFVDTRAARSPKFLLHVPEKSTTSTYKYYKYLHVIKNY